MKKIENIKDKVIKKIFSMRRELVEQLNNIDFQTIEYRVYLYKRIQSLNVFQELFVISYNKKCNQSKKELYITFKQETKDFLDSCRIQQLIEKSSWVIHLETYNIIKNIISQV
ncbi:hypothetical protein OW763_00355 [Clostridium aestuarii]|uniref:Uncharacterized protein n=1 Tax=Clostridium aestuarii TaxID=338193 RepID=A0ABT4CUZ5_9CLOT|nr:hypothetical protein [Clostridium aestuarii]MCY6482809.1 hypothetical protein [Clostridium aestuarii]